MKIKVANILLFITIVISLCACGNESSVDTDTLEYRNVTLSDEESKQLLNEMIHFVENTSSSKELSMFSDDVIIESVDITSGAGVTDYRYYISSNAAYLQIGDIMYRFQFNNSNMIISYIKYTVEA